MKTNGFVSRCVSRVYRDTAAAVRCVAGEGVGWAIFCAVYDAVRTAPATAVNEAVRDDPPHPALRHFLRGIRKVTA